MLTMVIITETQGFVKRFWHIFSEKNDPGNGVDFVKIYRVIFLPSAKKSVSLAKTGFRAKENSNSFSRS